MATQTLDTPYTPQTVIPTVSRAPATLNNTGVVPGTYGDTTHVGQFTVQADGRLTFAANVAITATGGLTSENAATSRTITKDITRITANSVALTTPAAPVDFQMFRVRMESAYTGCSIVANTGVFIENGVATTLNLARIVSIEFEYNLATTTWFCVNIKTGLVI